jgi:sugar O-acyltransferase (sialic acid O-acetyltransferase NeuD family)
MDAPLDALRRPQRVVILGAGGFAREVLDVYDACNQAGWGPFEVIGFLADGQPPGAIINERPVLGDVGWLAGADRPLAICAIGDPAVRRRVARRAAELGADFHSVVHPDARLTRWVTLGAGTVITAGCILTNQIRVGSHVHLNLDSTVGHDAVIDDFVTVAPGVHISGNVTLEAGTNIGTGAAILQGRRVGAGAVIGAGAVVTEDVPPDVVAVGVPARVVKARSPRWDEE